MAEHRQLTDSWGADLYECHGWQVVELHPPGDVYAEPLGLADAIWQLVSHWRPPRMVLDATHINFMSSSLMGVLVQIEKRVAVAGGEFHVACLGPHPTEALHACQLHTIIPLFPSVEAAAGYAT
jgi:anti-anti-sigma factor